MTDEEARLLHYMPIVVRSPDLTDWERSFCASIIYRSRKKAFAPTDKQRGVMQRIVLAFQTATMRDEPARGDDAAAKVREWSLEDGLRGVEVMGVTR